MLKQQRRKHFEAFENHAFLDDILIIETRLKCNLNQVLGPVLIACFLERIYQIRLRHNFSKNATKLLVQLKSGLPWPLWWPCFGPSYGLNFFLKENPFFSCISIFSNCSLNFFTRQVIAAFLVIKVLTWLIMQYK